MRNKIDPEKLYWANFNRFEMRIPGQAVIDCSHAGPCDDDVAAWAPKVVAQVEADNFHNRPTPDKIRAELKEYGAWEAEELADDTQNWHRLVWVACGDIADSDEPDCSEPINAEAAAAMIESALRS